MSRFLAINSGGRLNVVAAVVCAVSLGLAIGDRDALGAAVLTSFTAINLFCWYMVSRQQVSRAMVLLLLSAAESLAAEVKRLRAMSS